MRDILFRGKRIDNGEWAKGCLLIDYVTEQYFIHVSGNSVHESLKFFTYEVDPETVCQYTVATDKNGRKIFEGDILSAYLDDQCPEHITYERVTWNGFSWCVKWCTEKEGMYEDEVMLKHDCDVFEVCGNIFDNPELMKGAQDTWEAQF